MDTPSEEVRASIRSKGFMLRIDAQMIAWIVAMIFMAGITYANLTHAYSQTDGKVLEEKVSNMAGDIKEVKDSLRDQTTQLIGLVKTLVDNQQKNTASNQSRK